VFTQYADIEKVDDVKNNVNDFVLQYEVNYGNDSVEELTSFRMKAVSDYVRKELIIALPKQGIIDLIERLLHIYPFN